MKSKHQSKQAGKHRKMVFFCLALSGATSAFWTWILYHLLSDFPFWGYIGGQQAMLEAIVLVIVILPSLVFLLLLFASLLALPGTLESLGYSSKELTIWGESKTQP